MMHGQKNIKLGIKMFFIVCVNVDVSR